MRVILFGATGYTGRLTAARLGQHDVPLVLAGRSAQRLAGLRDELDVGAAVAVADATDPWSVAALLADQDVLVTTVGPFIRLGPPVARAAVAAGAGYLDSTGEPAFLRWLVETQDEPARARGATLVPAFGFDYAPGNLAAALVLGDAGGRAVGVRVGYYGLGGMSGGTVASGLGAILQPGYRWSGGRLVSESNAATVGSMMVAGRRRTGVSLSGSEHLFLPRTYSHLDRVEVYLGLGRSSAAGSRLAGVLATVGRVPGVRTGFSALVDWLPIASTGGPDPASRARSGCRVVGEALDGYGEVLSRVLLTGPDIYELTAGLLAEGAVRLAEGRVDVGAGVLGPVEAFGVPGLLELASRAGIVVEHDPAV